MQQIFVRPVNAEDAPIFIEWQKSNPNFDPKTVVQPSSFTLCAFTDDGPIAYLPVQKPSLNPFFMESIALRPGLSNLETVNSIKELIKGLVLIGFLGGTNEIYFLGDKPETNEFAEKYGFEKLGYPVYRMKLSDLQGTDATAYPNNIPSD